MSESTNKALGALSDEEFAQLSPSEIEAYLKAELDDDTPPAEGGESADDASEPVAEQDEAEPAAAAVEEVNEPDETGGADSGYQSLDIADETAGTTSADPFAGPGNEEASVEGADQGTEDDQSEAADGATEADDDLSGDRDWKADYEAVRAELDMFMAPFKASGRNVKVESPDDARRLMQQGYDYSNKMRELKPRLRTLRTLEHNDLLDDEKLNFMIDLMKGTPEAITKFLKDRDIDPIELDLEDSAPYEPNDHRVSDAQIALDEVLDSIRNTESFPRTAQVITKEWDKASQDVLMGMPQVIAIINDHMEKGIYDQITAKVDYERSLGRLVGLSDLDAYKAVGDAMQAQGAFAPAGARTTSADSAPQGHSQDSKGSSDSVKSRKRAASPTKGGAGAGKAQQPNYLGDYTDEEFEKLISGSL